jgi:hypothetical protein
MAAVQAYLDLQHFGSLPRAGGSFDQPSELMDELRYVAGRVEAAREREREKQKKKTERSAGRKRAGSRGRR